MRFEELVREGKGRGDWRVEELGRALEGLEV